MSLGLDPQDFGQTAPEFPPLLTGVEVVTGVDPFVKAVTDAGLGRAEAGYVYWSSDVRTLRAALVLEPEEPLAQALPILFAVGCGLNDSLGALAPPEVGVAHVWPDGVKVNGAWCGALRVDASTRDGAIVPDWVVVGISLSMQFSERLDPGAQPNMTALTEEGCGYLTVPRLIESWSKHTLVWINRWQDDGPRPIFDAWLNRADGRGKTVALAHGGRVLRGEFLGMDEAGGMIVKAEDGPINLPLARVLEEHRIWPPTQFEV